MDKDGGWEITNRKQKSNPILYAAFPGKVGLCIENKANKNQTFKKKKVFRNIPFYNGQ